MDGAIVSRGIAVVWPKKESGVLCGKSGLQ